MSAIRCSTSPWDLTSNYGFKFIYTKDEIGLCSYTHSYHTRPWLKINLICSV